MTWQPPIFSDEDLDRSETEHSDAELITAVRSGDESAYATLWTRHEAAARRLACQIANPSNADDLVSEAFLRVLRALKSGSGPDGAFRPYLFSTLRRINIDLGRSYYTRVALTDDERDLDLDLSDSAADTIVDRADESAAWRAWNSLPDSSKTLLWHLLIEEETPAQIAPLIGTTPNGVSSRAVRAKERLRQAFLQQHLLDAESVECRQARSRMGEYVRDALSNRDRIEVRAHLDTCAGCQAALFEISDLNQTMRVLIAPIILGGVAVAGHYIAATSAASVGAKAGGFAHFFSHGLKNPAVATTAAVTVAAVGVGAAFGISAIAASAPHKHPIAASAAPTPSRASVAPVPVPVGVAPVFTPTSIASTPTPTKPAPSKTPSNTPTPTPTPTPTVPIVVHPATTPPKPAPTPTRAITQVPVGFLTTQDSAGGYKIEFQPQGGWVVTKVTGVSGLSCATMPSADVTCTVSTPVTAGEQDFIVYLRPPTNPAVGSTMLWTYTDDNVSSNGVATIPGDS